MKSILKRFIKILLITIASFCLLSIGLILFLPTLISTQWGNKTVVAVINESIPGKLEIKNFSVSWFGTQKMEGLTLNDPSGIPVVKFESFETETPLITLLREGPSGTQTRINTLSAQIKRSGPGKTNLLDSLGTSQPYYESDFFHALIGDIVDLNVTEETKNNEISWKIEATSKYSQISANGTITNGIFRFTSPAKAALKITPQAIERLSPFIPNIKDWTINSTMELILDINELQFPMRFLTSGISRNERDQLALKASLSFPHAEFINKYDTTFRTTIKDIAFHVDAPQGSNEFHLDSKGSYLYGKTPVNYGIDTTLNKPGSIHKVIRNILQPLHIEFFLEDVPSNIIDELLGTDNAAFHTFGNSMSLKLHSVPKNPRALQLSLSSEKLNLPYALFQLDQDVAAVNDIETQQWTGSFKMENLSFGDAKDKPIINELHIPWSFNKGLKNAGFKFKGTTSDQNSQNGSFGGQFNLHFPGTLDQTSISLNVNGNNFPAVFLELLTGRDEIGAVFGRFVEVNLSTEIKNLNGTIQAILSGSNGSTDLKANVINNNLTLIEPFTLKTKGTKELAENVLSKIAPVLGEMVASEGTIKLTISPDMFSLPLHNLNVANVQIGHAVLDAGKLIFRNDGDVKDLLSVLRPARSDKITVWTTPLHLSMKKGVLGVSRMDMLIMNRYPIATWGSIDFAKDKVNMVIGLTGPALTHAFDIQGLDKNTMVQIPVKGTVKKAKIDSGKATTKIGTLIAQNSSRPEAFIIGTVLGLASGKEEKVPAPTTNPLPWDETVDNQTKTKPKASKNPAKLLKGLFQ